VCDNIGGCNACTPGTSCTDGINAVCQTGAIDCTTGKGVCKASNKSGSCSPGPSCSGGHFTDQSTCVNGSCSTPTAVNCTSGACDGSQCLSCSTPPGASSQPTGITGAGTTICPGTSITLKRSGGALGQGASWVWSTDASFIGSRQTGESITVSPTSSTQYYVRAEGTCGNSPSASQVVNVSPPAQFASDSNPQDYGATCSSGWVTFTAAPSSGTKVISTQWWAYFVSDGASAAAPIDTQNRYYQGATTSTLQVAIVVPMASQYVWCVITDACGEKASRKALLTMPDLLTCP
jgi:hypothetical protein